MTLRAASETQPTNTGFIGVRRMPNGTFSASAKLGQTQTHLGIFATPEEAALAVARADKAAGGPERRAQAEQEARHRAATTALMFASTSSPRACSTLSISVKVVD